MAGQTSFIAAVSTPMPSIQNTQLLRPRSIFTKTALRLCKGIYRCGYPSMCKERSLYW
jgi:hypothetical protein